MFHHFSNKDQNITNVLDSTINRLNAKDPTLMQEIANRSGTQDPARLELNRVSIISACQNAKNHVASDPATASPAYVSRDPFVGLVQTNIGQNASTLDPPALANLASDWQQYGDADPRWALCPIVSFFSLNEKPFPFVQQSNILDFVWMEHRTQFTIALMADWGAPNDTAKMISDLIKARQPDYVIHLGDVYYAGTQLECQAVLDMWPLCDASGKPLVDRCFALNGNHEMFCGARNYFGTILTALHQPASFFRLQSEYWQFFGLDSAYTGGRLNQQAVQSQWDWLVANLNANPALANVLMTHHQPVSAHAQEAHDAQQLHTDGETLLGLTRPDAIFAWIFGHEHRAAVYDDTVTPYKARLIGNGCIPHDAQIETGPDNDPLCTRFTSVSSRTWGEGNAISSWLLLSVDGPQITLEYIDQDGQPSSLPTEVWTTTLAGQPFV
jgi:hypothetical protein